MTKKIRVFVVDDSAVVRQVLTAMLAKDSSIEVIGSAPDPIFALDKMNLQWPDVVVLDVEMPRMDGITFLKQLMSTRPIPVVICSTLTTRGADTTMQALAAGAVGVVTKPKAGLRNFLEADEGDIVAAVKAAAAANMRMVQPSIAKPLNKQVLQKASGTEFVSTLNVTTDKIVAIGTSTGGTQALEVVLTELPRTAPGIVIVQHMPEKFTQAFSERLDKICEINVMEAKNGDRVIPGRALIAPGGRHMVLRKNGAQYSVEIIDAPPVNRHRPSVDVLFRSVAKSAGKNAAGIIMTGMGDDGALGLKEMREAGAETWAQDEKTCVVYGMPKEAVKVGAVETITPLQNIANVIVNYGKRNF